MRWCIAFVLLELSVVADLASAQSASTTTPPGARASPPPVPVASALASQVVGHEWSWIDPTPPPDGGWAKIRFNADGTMSGWSNPDKPATRHWEVTGPHTARATGGRDRVMALEFTFDDSATQFACQWNEKKGASVHKVTGIRLQEASTPKPVASTAPTSAAVPWITLFGNEFPKASAWASSSLATPVPPAIRDGVTKLAQGLAAEAAKAPQVGGEAYASAVKVCQFLTVALNDRAAFLGAIQQKTQKNIAVVAGKYAVAPEDENAWQIRNARFHLAAENEHFRFIEIMKRSDALEPPTVLATTSFVPLPPFTTEAQASAAATVHNATPAPNAAAAATKPGGVVLDKRWDGPLGLSGGGPAVQGKELHALLDGFAQPGTDTGAHPNTPIYRTVTYLLPLQRAEADMGVAGKIASGGKTAAVGFPDGLKFVEFTPEAGRDFTIRLLKDVADQVVAIEFVALNERALPAPPERLPTDPKRRHELHGTVCDFVPEGATAIPRQFPQTAWELSSYVLISTRGGPKAADLYIPKPMVSLILHSLESRR